MGSEVYIYNDSIINGGIVFPIIIFKNKNKKKKFDKI